MSDVNAEPVIQRCTKCGGVIKNDYLSGNGVCVSCGNIWALADLIPNYETYSKTVEKINRANELMEKSESVADIKQAKNLLVAASEECSKYIYTAGADLKNGCDEGIAKADQYIAYERGKTFIEQKAYRSAVDEFKKIPGFKDVDELAADCKIKIEEAQRRQVPINTVFSLILPLILCVVLKEFAGFPIWSLALILVACAAGLFYLMTLEGAWGVVIKVLSIVCAVPLIIFALLAYVFRLPVITSAIIAVVGPIVVSSIFMWLGDKKI